MTNTEDLFAILETANETPAAEFVAPTFEIVRVVREGRKTPLWRLLRTDLSLDLGVFTTKKTAAARADHVAACLDAEFNGRAFSLTR